MKKLIDTAPKQKTAVVIAVATDKQSESNIDECLNELIFLAQTVDVKVIKSFKQNRDTIDSKIFVGKGKLEEIKDFIKTNDIDIAVFDDELTPSQIRNLEREINCIVLDRTFLILSIFEMRAKTSQAKTQVALAKYQYMLPRLTKMWTHLSRQQGGNVGMRGPGEKEIETDRRIIQNKITHLRQKLKDIERQTIVQKNTRVGISKVALVGYTNVGKSTIMNALSKSTVLVEDKLFATVDSVVRKVETKSIQFLLSDTVGFIRKLPHTLVECFKSTLSQVKEADLLLHVVDISNTDYKNQIEVVNETLIEIGAINIPIIIVYNKIDQIDFSMDNCFPKEWLGNPENNLTNEITDVKCIALSATKGTNIETLKSIIQRHICIDVKK